MVRQYRQHDVWEGVRYAEVNIETFCSGIARSQKVSFFFEYDTFSSI
jgi:hypothetical protein